MRQTARDRARAVSDIVSQKPDEQWLLWCNTDYEAAALREVLPDAVEASGSMTTTTQRERREKLLMGFADGSVRQLITKPRIAGMGLNYQSCANMAFVGMSHSFDAMYQAMRRCWRFGQTREVHAHIICADAEWSILESVERKQEDHERMVSNMVEAVRKHGLGACGSPRMKLDYEALSDGTGQWQYMLGDSVDRLREIESESVGFTIFSPPFSNLYTYSDSLRDMGNCEDHEAFFRQYQFMVPELLRVTMPGRLCAVHCKDLPTYRGRDGASGLYDFPGDLVRAMEAGGWDFHSRVTIWKCPVTERERTNNNGLLHKTVKRDSSQIRQGLADYVLVFRKTPTESNLSSEPIERPGGFGAYVGDSDPNESSFHPSPYARTGGTADPALAIWRRYAEPVWWDIDQTDVLNVKEARDGKDEKQIGRAHV